MVSVIAFFHLVGDWPSKLHQSPVCQAFRGSVQAFMATIKARGNKSPAMLRPAQQSPTYLFLATTTWMRHWLHLQWDNNVFGLYSLAKFARVLFYFLLPIYRIFLPLVASRYSVLVMSQMLWVWNLLKHLLSHTSVVVGFTHCEHYHHENAAVSC